MGNAIEAEFQVLFHPDLQQKPKEVALLYSTNEGRNWEDYYANNVTKTNWYVNMYDIPVGQKVEFFVRAIMDDGRIMLIKKENKNYKIEIKDNTNSGKYRAQVRVTEENFVPMGRRCLVCEKIIPKGKNMCQNPDCAASFCPKCNRMLPPYSNFCPWDQETFPLN